MNGGSAGVFTGIVQKEFRENFKWAILLMFILSALLISDLKQLANTDVRVMEINLPAMFDTMALVTPFIGLIIGLAQAVRENRGDKWGFLTHRPVSRSTLFWGKAVAGILLYTAAVALPWLSSLVWLSMPGHVPLPFDPHMALPGAADLLCGVVYYFAGLLTGMRDARWFASRALGIGVGIVCSIACLAVGSLEWAVAFIAGGLVINVAAAWGAFVGGGRYEAQPRVTRVATGIAIGSGLLMVCFILFSIVGTFVSAGDAGSQPPRYTVDVDGNIVRERFEEGRIAAIEDPQGRPIEKYKDFEARDTSMRGVVERGIGISSFQVGIVPNSFRSTRRFFLTLYPEYTGGTYEPVRWYYVMREGLIAAFDSKTLRLIGWMGPGGFSAGADPPRQRFTPPLMNKNSVRQPLIAFEDAVYRLDLGHRRIEKIFTPSPGEFVLGAEGTNSYDSSAYVSDARAGFDAIATTQRVVIQSQNGTVEMSAPLDPRAVDYDEVSIYRAVYAPDKPTFIWYRAYRMNRPQATPELVNRYDSGNALVAHDELPQVSSPSSMSWAAAPVFLAVPITVRAALAKPWRGENGKIDLSQGMSQSQRTVSWLLPILSSLVSAAAIFARGRKFAFTNGRLTTWTVLGFILGPFGFLLMLSLVEWPVRERCPACGRMRVVTHEHCEHCSKPFAPPHPDGTEVFELT
jgi:F0F1-type ATP synthase assembly protein I